MILEYGTKTYVVICVADRITTGAVASWVDRRDIIVIATTLNSERNDLSLKQYNINNKE